MRCIQRFLARRAPTPPATAHTRLALAPPAPLPVAIGPAESAQRRGLHDTALHWPTGWFGWTTRSSRPRRPHTLPALASSAAARCAPVRPGVVMRCEAAGHRAIEKLGKNASKGGLQGPHVRPEPSDGGREEAAMKSNPATACAAGPGRHRGESVVNRPGRRRRSRSTCQCNRDGGSISLAGVPVKSDPRQEPGPGGRAAGREWSTSIGETAGLQSGGADNSSLVSL